METLSLQIDNRFLNWEEVARLVLSVGGRRRYHRAPVPDHRRRLYLTRKATDKHEENSQSAYGLRE